MAEMTEQERAYFIFRGALQAIEAAGPTLTTAEMRQVARSALQRVSCCPICGSTRTMFEGCCSRMCLVIYQTFAASKIFQGQGGGRGETGSAGEIQAEV